MSDKFGKFQECAICENYDWELKHRCPPKFFFKHEAYGDDFIEIYAYDFDSAADKFAKKYNESGDYPLMNNPTEVTISDGKTEKTFTVYANPSIEYSSEETFYECKVCGNEGGCPNGHGEGN